ncbi:alpha-N-arabinofuranosidase 2 [Penicillium argentinense]|uniref:Alpha-N-arabinofuranosidase 2 n=1 Tax=Penicillium argentinense TaxID=1131581 RepID=A0A9W9JY66_9EURO|nr:alpha-N-arabinofuranosidase 2 [Penicillium argentinense]KAJ5085696.1 alpha-N-arabinofuranosidase 2 [Penicillium argentinense]
MVHHEDWYLSTYSTNDNITLKRSRALTDNWDNAETKLVFKPDSSSGEPWSTDSHSRRRLTPPSTRRDVPIRMSGREPPNVRPRERRAGPLDSNYTVKGMLNTFDQFAIDGTYIRHKDVLYHIYSCWKNFYGAWPANLCITRLSNPWNISSTLTERRTISFPNEPWNKPHTDGPTGQNLVLYSAARVNTPFYCLGMLDLVGDDLMEYQSWKKHRDGCFFHQNPDAGVYGTGHASYTTSPEGSESYVVYPALTTNDPDEFYRTVRTQKMEWNEDGTLSFPKAMNGPFPVPKGQH